MVDVVLRTMPDDRIWSLNTVPILRQCQYIEESSRAFSPHGRSVFLKGFGDKLGAE
jgi:hypothetical protein